MSILTSLSIAAEAQEYRVYTNEHSLGFIIEECNDTDYDMLADKPEMVFDYRSLWFLALAIIIFLLLLGKPSPFDEHF